jgi:predicted RecB family nuclease
MGRRAAQITPPRTLKGLLACVLFNCNHAAFCDHELNTRLRSDRTMGSSDLITATVFAAYLKCPTKGFLLARGEERPGTFFGDLTENVSIAYKASIGGFSPIKFSELAGSSRSERTTTFVDSETAFYLVGHAAAIDRSQNAKRPRPSSGYTPILYSAWNKVEKSDQAVVAFCALAIGQATRSVPPKGKIIHGNTGRTRTVRIADLLPKTQQIIEAIAKDRDSNKPSSVALNKHCSICDFQSRCRSIAINQQDLSLLGAMTEKERTKCTDKGITTITQLSYGYRPRRRKSVKSTTSRGVLFLKHDHKLKALAIKKAQVHVVGAPALSIEGTPVFIDVEGAPGHNSYYLIGLRYKSQGSYMEQSFWADRQEGECGIWRECLGALKEINTPRLIHYGAYESRFLKLMRTRYPSTDEDGAFVDQVVDRSINLISTIYGKIYFPTYSNSLKEIARWLGFEWTWPLASGAGATLLRRRWELTSDDELRRALVLYNLEDCRAAELVSDAIRIICGNDAQSGAMKFETVNVSSLEVRFQRTFGKFPSALPEFEKINAAAYWDYQRSKVYVRTDKVVRQSVKKAARLIRRVVVEKEVMAHDRPGFCPRCGSPKIWIAARASNVIFDLKFTRRGIKRWAIRYRYNNFRCGSCKTQMTPQAPDSKYGPNLRAYIVYLLIEMRLSHQKIREHIATVFDIPILGTKVNVIKSDLARKYDPTYRAILEQIKQGPVVHADETKGVVYGGGHYVWIFANLTTVAYVYSASREASTVIDILAGFNGVLVSDFYGGYDSIPCQQQKCLIHLMRDINEDLLKHPFNDELTFVAKRFGTLLRDIVETVDRYGLKRFHLGKHKRAATQFLSDVAALHSSTEVGSVLKRRIEKNRDKLFTFLDHDGVPWNNNNAEHAVRAFTRLRNGMATSTPKGTTDYCVLLSLQQTLGSRGISFLDFLRSGRSEIGG